MDQNPTADQLRDLIRVSDDPAGEYVLWVTAAGDVRLDRVPDGQNPDEFRDAHPDMRLRFDPFTVGDLLVGPDAADDPFWAEDVLWALRDEWQAARGQPGAVHLGQI